MNNYLDLETIMTDPIFAVIEDDFPKDYVEFTYVSYGDDGEVRSEVIRTLLCKKETGHIVPLLNAFHGFLMGMTFSVTGVSATMGNVIWTGDSEIPTYIN